jgi:hypothetical protein
MVIGPLLETLQIHEIKLCSASLGFIALGISLPWLSRLARAFFRS